MNKKRPNKEDGWSRLGFASIFLFATVGLATPLSASGNGVQAVSINMAEEQYEVTGIVTDENGEPIIGATVLEKGTRNVTISDFSGEFSIKTSKKRATLVFSYVGYITKEVSLNGATKLTVGMEPENQMLNEVVVTGYGTFKKSAYAGSASMVKADKLKDIPATSFQDMLQGNAPGVQFSQSSGQPGASVSLKIRGMGSFNASNSPLYVIDGVPVTSGNVSALDTDAGLDLMSTISTADIENITVIKDAAAASLYGSRAANGVVIITTKKGKSGKPQVSLKADWGYSDFAMDFRPIMNGEQRRETIYNGFVASALKSGKSDEEAKAYADKYIDDYAPIPWCGYVDWDKLMFKKGDHQTYEASISGGADRFKYFSSISYLKQNGITRNSGLERLTARVNAEYQATKNLKIGANILFSNVNQDTYGEGTSYTSPFYALRNKVTGNDAVYNEDGSWNRDFISNGDRNPLLAATYNTKREYITRAFNTLFGEYEFMKGLKLKSTISYDFNHSKGVSWYDPRTSDGDDTNGGLYKAMYERSKLVWANQMSYVTKFGDDHNFDALIGYEIDDQKRDFLSADASYFASANKPAMSNAAVVEGASGYNNGTRLVSYLARVNYDYQNKYFAGASFRTDGSSRFHKDNRWGNFWSASAAWRMIEEDFMKPASSWLTDLKLRASYGVNGTLPSDYFGYMGLSSLSSSYNGENAIILSQIENKDLKWETNYNFNLGLDFALFNRVNVSLEYYTRTTKDLLIDCPISNTTGFANYLMNIGEVKNSGIELEINSTNIKTKDFIWTTNFNISHNKNKIVTLDGEQTQIISGNQIHKIGESYRTFYLIEFAGINPENGEPQFIKNSLNEDGTLDKSITESPAEANPIALDKHAEPAVNGGFTNTLCYKWFDLSFMFSYQFGAYGYDTWAQKTESGGYDSEVNIPSYYLDAWKKPGDITDYELFNPDRKSATAMSKFATTRRLHSTDFIRLKTLTFGFTLPKEWLRTVGFDNVRLYCSANNLWTWAKYDYYDPEVVSSGATGWGTPPLKTVTFGLNINF